MFQGIKYFINDSINPKIKQKLAELLDSKGAEPCLPLEITSRFDSTTLTHFITDTLDFPEYHTMNSKDWRKAGDRAEQHRIDIVLPSWVTRSVDTGRLFETRAYSVHHANIFAGCFITTSNLPDLDNLAIQTGVESLGGAWRRELTQEVTHLITVAPVGVKYQAWTEFGEPFGMVCVLPDWFEACIRSRQRVPTPIYEFPDPQYCSTTEWGATDTFIKRRLLDSPRYDPSTNLTAAILGSLDHNSKTGRERADSYYKTATISVDKGNCEDESLRAGFTDSMTSVATAVARKLPLIDLSHSMAPIFADRRVYLASDLGLRKGLEQALKERIIEAGGECWSWGVDGDAITAQSEGRSVDQWEKRRVAEKELRWANTVVTRTREGWEFWHAFDTDKTLGNLAWLYHTLAVSKLDAPLDHLLHYPRPAHAIPGFEGLEITISNYTASSRDYVRTLIEVMGGTFNGTMSRSTNIVISASQEGVKFEHATRWEIPIVTHHWLESCYLAWTSLPYDASSTFSTAQETVYHLSDLLGRTAFPFEAILTWAERPEVKLEKEAALASWEEEEQSRPGDDLEIDMAGEFQIDEEEQRSLTREEEKDRSDDEDDYPRVNDHVENGENSDEERMEVDEEMEDVEQNLEKEDVEVIAEVEEEDESSIEIVSIKKSQGKSRTAEEVQLVEEDAIVEEEPVVETKKKEKKEKKKGKKNVEEEQIEMEVDELAGGESLPQKQIEIDELSEEADESNETEVAKKVEAKPKSKPKAVKVVKSKSKNPAGAGAEANMIDRLFQGEGENGVVTAVSRRTLSPTKMSIPISRKSSPTNSNRLVATPVKSNPPSPVTRSRATPIASTSARIILSHSSAARGIALDNILPAGNRRAAAAGAQRFLKQQMEDKNRFEMEQRSSGKQKRTKNRAHGGAGIDSMDIDSDIRDDMEDDLPKSKRAKGKGKKKAVDHASSDDAASTIKSSKRQKTVVGRAIAAAQQLVDACTGTTTMSSFDKSLVVKAPKKKLAPPKIQFLTTGVEVEEADVDAFTLLGAKHITVPSASITHLVVSGIMRTEKFLCALAYGPMIVSQAWITDSVAQHKLLDGSAYAIVDPEKEEKWEMNLAQSLNLCRERKIFEGYTFFFTKQCSPSRDTLKKIVECHGAVAKYNNPTHRDIVGQTHHYVISSPSDRKIWDKLASTVPKTPIYTTEAVMMSILRQKSEFESTENSSYRCDLQV